MIVEDEVEALLSGWVRDYLAANNIAGVDVYQGWQENENFSVPSISVTVGTPSYSTNARKRYSVEDIDAETVAVTWRVGRWTCAVTVEFYSQSKTERSALYGPIRKKFVGGMSNDSIAPTPRGNGLELVDENYHNARVRFRLLSGGRKDHEGLNDGYFRATSELEVVYPELTVVEYTRAAFEADIITE